MKDKIAIIGFGKLGKALADILEIKKEHCLTCAWDIVATGDPRQIHHCDEAVEDALAVFIVVPSSHFSTSLKNLACVKNGVPLITCTKGLDDITKKLPINLLELKFPQNPVAVLSGPMLSEELAEGSPTHATLAGKKEKDLKAVFEIFSDTSLSLTYSNDPIGVSLCGILKNVYALGLGLSDGLGLGSNFKSCLALKALKEMREIIKSQGGREDTIFTPAGIADFLATGYSPKSRNYSYGFKTGQKENPGTELAEGVKNIANIFSMVKNSRSFPLLNLIKNIFIDFEPATPEILSRVIK